MRFLYLFSTFLLFLGCNTKEERTIERVVEKPTTYQGPIDSGGGNGIAGRPIESYHVSIPDQKLFQDLLMPIIQTLASLHPELAGDMYHVVLDRKWYFVPVELAKIPSQLIGAHSETDQLALQTYKEIWFDDVKFQAMDESAKTRILLHEMVMGVRLLQFQAKLDLCLGESVRELLKPHHNGDEQKTNESNYSNLRQACYETYGGLPGLSGQKPIVLGETDYTVIRDLTTLISDGLADAKAQELESLYKQLNRRLVP